MDRAYFYAGRVLAVLALDRKIDKPLFRYQGSFVVMFGVLKVDQATPLKPEDPDPVELMVRSGVIVFFDTGVDAFSASDAPGEIQSIPPEGIRKGLLRADLEFLPVFFKVSLFEFGDDPLSFLPRSSPGNVSGGSLRPPLLNRRREEEGKGRPMRSVKHSG